MSHILYVLALVAVAVSIPEAAYESRTGDVVFLLGVLGIWRYGWGVLHYVRCLYFKFVAFPRMRRRATRAVKEVGLGHAFFLLTSFRIDAPTTARVYRGAIEAALRAPAGATIVASIVELGDQRLIEQLFATVLAENGVGRDAVRLKFVRIPGTGKRDALTYGFRAIAAYEPGPDDTASVIDGDSIVPPDLVEKCASIFLLDPKIGALTTDETCIVEGREIFKQWYSLRFAQRQILMCSMGLSQRVLTLTGRMSMFRAHLVCRPEFYEHINQDYIDHWRLGRIKMLTGDDKSSWFWLLKNGYTMPYVPDVIVETIEQPPLPGFVESAKVLMTRWFGNMLRTNGRALRLGPWRTGIFPYLAILDQRISMWTCLSGLVIAILGTIFVSPFVLLFYLLWVATSRYIMCLSFLTVRPSLSVSWPFLLYFNQIFGSFIKIYIFFRLDRQRWTRQQTTLGLTTGRLAELYGRASSTAMHTMAMVVYVAVIAYVIDIFPKPIDRFAVARGTFVPNAAGSQPGSQPQPGPEIQGAVAPAHPAGRPTKRIVDTARAVPNRG